MTAALETAAAAPRVSAPEHIVDVLIRERAPRLSASPAWPLLRPLLYAALGYKEARKLADAIADLGGAQALDLISRWLALKVAVRGVERIPHEGRMIAVVNHPTGLADGVAVDDVLRRARPGLCYFANADALRVSPRLGEVLVPVEWVEAKRTRERTRLTVKLAQAALDAGRPIVIFPAGRIARVRSGRLADPAWAPSCLSLARRHHAPVLPIHLKGPPSTLFRLLDHVSPELRDITLFHELFNKRGGAFELTIGPPIPPEAIADPAEDILRLKAYVEHVLPDHPDQPFA
jgi:putative hemolysin